ncbi:MAG: hypothetical protein ABI467_01815 [Kofleriaceae bacterium]
MGARQLVMVMVVAVPATAHAGRSFYGWLQDTQVMPERGAELWTFISEENRQGPTNNRDTTWWFAPAIGINDQLELELPVQFAWDRADDSPPRTSFVGYGAQLKYRFVTADPVDAPDFVPAIRASIDRVVIGTRDHWVPEVDLIGSYQTGRLDAVVNAGVVGEVAPDEQHFEAHTGAGVSIETVADLRFGAEVFAEISLDSDTSGSWIAVGPNLSWSHGRSWLSASYGIGVYQIRDAPKLNWGIAF